MAGTTVGALARATGPLTYADPTAPALERAFINLVEVMGGRSTLVRLYEPWCPQWPSSGMPLWSSALHWLGVSLDMGGESWPPINRTACWVASRSARRPKGSFKILAHSQLIRVPELIPYFLRSTSTRPTRGCATTSSCDAARSTHCGPARRS
jgi:hypothetical protein